MQFIRHLRRSPLGTAAAVRLINRSEDRFTFLITEVKKLTPSSQEMTPDQDKI